MSAGEYTFPMAKPFDFPSLVAPEAATAAEQRHRATMSAADGADPSAATDGMPLRGNRRVDVHVVHTGNNSAGRLTVWLYRGGAWFAHPAATASDVTIPAAGSLWINGVDVAGHDRIFVMLDVAPGNLQAAGVDIWVYADLMANDVA